MKSKADHAAYMREWLARNREKVNAQTRARKAADPDGVRAKRKAWAAVQSEESKQKDAARKQAWAEANREKVRTANKLYTARAGGYWKHIKHKFGVTRDAWEELFAAQGERCAVCGANDVDTKRFWQIDHCHATGAVRGILCAHCNAMLGRARDNPDILIAGANYLKSHYYCSSSAIL